MTPTRLRNLLLAFAPVIFLFVLFQHGLHTYFFQDDFAWLSLLRQATSWNEFLYLMFTPMAQGTLRPISERGFFMLMLKLFGFDAYPFHMVVFLTMSANLLLLTWLTRRLTGSAVAAFAAPWFWAGNAALVTVMTWNSSYNEVLCALCLMGSLALFFRFSESGRKRFWWLQLLVFLTGFGVLEINIVYPAIAAAWVWFLAPVEQRRRLFFSLIPLALISVAYYVFHRLIAPLPKTGPYVFHWDLDIFRTLALYWKWTVWPNQWKQLGHSQLTANLIVASGCLAMSILAWFGWKRRSGVLAFAAAWYLITLGPTLPLSQHHTDYYLTIPVAGFALAAAVGTAWAWQSGCAWQSVWLSRGFAALPILIYFGSMAPIVWGQTLFWEKRAADVRMLVQGVVQAKRAHPARAIVLEGVTSFLFDDAVGQSAFYPFGIDDVYLVAGSELKINPAPGNAPLEDLVLEPGVLRNALIQEQVVIYSWTGDHLRNITAVYEQTTAGRLVDRLPARVDVGNPLFSWLLGPEWSKLESGSRWMPARATVRLRIPQNGNKLALEGYLPVEQLRERSRHLRVSAAGILIGETQINDPESNFRRLFSLPAELKGREAVDLEIQVDPVIRKDGEVLGAIFGKIVVRP